MTSHQGDPSKRKNVLTGYGKVDEEIMGTWPGSPDRMDELNTIKVVLDESNLSDFAKEGVLLMMEQVIDKRCNEAVVKELKDMLEGFTLGFAKTNDPEFMEIMQPILNVFSDRIAELTTEQEKG